MAHSKAQTTAKGTRHGSHCIYETYNRLVANGLVADKVRSPERVRVIVRGYQRQSPEMFPCRCDEEC